MEHRSALWATFVTLLLVGAIAQDSTNGGQITDIDVVIPNQPQDGPGSNSPFDPTPSDPEGTLFGLGQQSDFDNNLDDLEEVTSDSFDQNPSTNDENNPPNLLSQAGVDPGLSESQIVSETPEPSGGGNGFFILDSSLIQQSNLPSNNDSSFPTTDSLGAENIENSQVASDPITPSSVEGAIPPVVPLSFTPTNDTTGGSGSISNFTTQVVQSIPDVEPEVNEGAGSPIFAIKDFSIPSSSSSESPAVGIPNDSGASTSQFSVENILSSTTTESVIEGEASEAFSATPGPFVPPFSRSPESGLGEDSSPADIGAAIENDGNTLQSSPEFSIDPAIVPQFVNQNPDILLSSTGSIGENVTTADDEIQIVPSSTTPGVLLFPFDLSSLGSTDIGANPTLNDGTEKNETTIVGKVPENFPTLTSIVTQGPPKLFEFGSTSSLQPGQIGEVTENAGEMDDQQLGLETSVSPIGGVPIDPQATESIPIVEEFGTVSSINSSSESNLGGLFPIFLPTPNPNGVSPTADSNDLGANEVFLAGRATLNSTESTPENGDGDGASDSSSVDPSASDVDVSSVSPLLGVISAESSLPSVSTSTESDPLAAILASTESNGDPQLVSNLLATPSQPIDSNSELTSVIYSTTTNPPIFVAGEGLINSSESSIGVSSTFVSSGAPPLLFNINGISSFGGGAGSSTPVAPVEQSPPSLEGFEKVSKIPIDPNFIETGVTKVISSGSVVDSSSSVIDLSSSVSLPTGVPSSPSDAPVDGTVSPTGVPPFQPSAEGPTGSVSSIIPQDSAVSNPTASSPIQPSAEISRPGQQTPGPFGQITTPQAEPEPESEPSSSTGAQAGSGRPSPEPVPESSPLPEVLPVIPVDLGTPPAVDSSTEVPIPEPPPSIGSTPGSSVTPQPEPGAETITVSPLASSGRPSGDTTSIEPIDGSAGGDVMTSVDPLNVGLTDEPVGGLSISAISPITSMGSSSIDVGSPQASSSIVPPSVTEAAATEPSAVFGGGSPPASTTADVPASSIGSPEPKPSLSPTFVDISQSNPSSIAPVTSLSPFEPVTSPEPEPQPEPPSSSPIIVISEPSTTSLEPPFGGSMIPVIDSSSIEPEIGAPTTTIIAPIFPVASETSKTGLTQSVEPIPVTESVEPISVSQSSVEPIPVSETVQPVLVSQSVEPIPVSESVEPISVSQSVEPIPVSESVEPISVSQSVEPIPVTQSLQPITTQSVEPIPVTETVLHVTVTQSVEPIPVSQSVEPISVSQSVEPISVTQSTEPPIPVTQTVAPKLTTTDTPLSPTNVVTNYQFKITNGAVWDDAMKNADSWQFTKLKKQLESPINEIFEKVLGEEFSSQKITHLTKGSVVVHGTLNTKTPVEKQRVVDQFYRTVTENGGKIGKYGIEKRSIVIGDVQGVSEPRSSNPAASGNGRIPDWAVGVIAAIVVLVLVLIVISLVMFGVKQRNQSRMMVEKQEYMDDAYTANGSVTGRSWRSDPQAQMAVGGFPPQIYEMKEPLGSPMVLQPHPPQPIVAIQNGGYNNNYGYYQGPPQAPYGQPNDDVALATYARAMKSYYHGY